LAAPFVIKLTVAPAAVTLLAVLLLQAVRREGGRWPAWAWIALFGALLAVAALAAVTLLQVDLFLRTAWFRLTTIRPDFFSGRPLWWMIMTYAQRFWGRFSYGTVGLSPWAAMTFTGLVVVGWLASLRLLFLSTGRGRYWSRVAVAASAAALLLIVEGRLTTWWRLPWPALAWPAAAILLIWARERAVGGLEFTPSGRRGWALVWLAAILALTITLKNTLTTPQYEGRFLFPTLGPIALLATAGWNALLPARPARLLPWGLLLALSALNLALWLTKVVPSFYQPLLD
jgi:hypothetical protein